MTTNKKGAGKPALYGRAMKRHNVHLSDWHVDIALLLSGEISAGIRLALEVAAKEHGLTPRAADGATRPRKSKQLADK